MDSAREGGVGGPSARTDASMVVSAGLSRRILAYIVDALLVGTLALAAVSLLELSVGPAVRFVPQPGRVAAIPVLEADRVLLDTLVATLVSGLYFVGSWIRWRATPGQRWLGLRVGDRHDPGRLEAGQAVIRWLALGAPWGLAAALSADSALGAPVALAAVLWPVLLLIGTALDLRGRRGPHDLVAHTIVLAGSQAGGHAGRSRAAATPPPG